MAVKLFKLSPTNSGKVLEFIGNKESSFEERKEFPTTVGKNSKNEFFFFVDEKKLTENLHIQSLFKNKKEAEFSEVEERFIFPEVEGSILSEVISNGIQLIGGK